MEKEEFIKAGIAECRKTNRKKYVKCLLLGAVYAFAVWRSLDILEELFEDLLEKSLDDVLPDKMKE